MAAIRPKVDHDADALSRIRCESEAKERIVHLFAAPQCIFYLGFIAAQQLRIFESNPFVFRRRERMKGRASSRVA